jgi:protein gp37
METWNPWHGCYKISPGCQNCYVYRRDGSFGKDASVVAKTASFDLPVKRKKGGEYKLVSGREVFTCGTSDFFLEEADEWRRDAWRFIRERSDLDFLIITKRIHRFRVNLPEDWEGGYPNVRIGCTVENQAMAVYRLPIFTELPIARRVIICEPLLEYVELSPYLSRGIDQVVAGGESGKNARVCSYDWVLHIREQCMENNVPFYFKQTGAFFKKDGKIYAIPRKLQHIQARKAGIDL